jgi:DNA polymerase-4
MSEFAERFLHVDMDAFFVEVERLADPTLRGKAVIVGGLGPRGVVSSASYEARRHGVRSAMPMGEARRRCRTGSFVAPDHSRYSAISAEVFAILREITPFVEGLSIDEAFLDVSGLRFHYPDPEAVGAAVRSSVRDQIGIPSSVGIAATKFIAKLASGHAKPDGMLRVPAGSEAEFLAPLPITELWGVGEATRASLENLGVHTIGELREVPVDSLERRLGASAGAHLAALSRGEDPRVIVTDSAARSVSVEETFDVDRTDRVEIERELLRLCDRLIGRLRRSGLAARTVTLKVRFGDFSMVTRSETLDEVVRTVPALRAATARLLDRARVGRRPVRLLGVGASGLVGSDEPRQISMLGAERDAAAEAAEDVRRRFGDGAVVPARLLDQPGSLEQEGDVEGR